MTFENLRKTDPEVYSCVYDENERQKHGIELIASENFVSKAVLEAQGSSLTNKYAEGYPHKRYYGGCEYVDQVEILAVERAKKLFNAQFANVQPHSGSQANQAVFLALLKPFDTIMSLSLDCGGHLTHGSQVNLSGKWFNVVHYGVRPGDNTIDYDQVEELARVHKPKLIIAGYSAYPRKIDFARFRKIADISGSYLMADIAHIAGIVAANMHSNPIEYADVVTTTTHKTLRGPRGGMILTNNSEIAKLINSSVFPGLQGGPMMHIIAAKAVAFGEALQDNFKTYIKQVILNAQMLSGQLIARGYDIITGGTDNHLLIMDLRKKDITGKEAELRLMDASIVSNKNTIPFDTKGPMTTSGLRLGSAACTTRGMNQDCFKNIGDWIADILDVIKDDDACQLVTTQVMQKAKKLCQEFPIP